MRDYDPDYVYMIPIKYKKREVYFETVSKVPARFRGAMIMEDEQKNNIDFHIYSPKGDVVYSNSTNQFIFDFNVTEIGSYKIIFDNRYSNTDLKVTYTMNVGQNLILKKEDLSMSEEKANSIVDFMKRYSVTYKMRDNLHFTRINSN